MAKKDVAKMQKNTRDVYSEAVSKSPERRSNLSGNGYLPG